jgi:hypothetical protein
VQLLLAEQDPFVFPTFVSGVVITIALGFVETHRRREWALLGNLGVRPRELVALLLLPPIVGETVLGIVHGVLA